MIRSYFGIPSNPFEHECHELLAHQQDIFEILLVHCQQGGLSIIAGEPGTGKSVLKTHLQHYDTKRIVAPSIGRTLHTYHTVLRILCEAFEVDFDGGDFKCEARIIEEAFRLNRLGKAIAIIIDDAHLMDIHCLRKIRLLLEEFPKNHNLVLFAQPQILDKIRLSSNQDIHSRITYSAIVKRLADEAIEQFILKQFDLCGLPHNLITEDALSLIARSAQGYLRFARFLTVASLIEAVRKKTRTVSIEQVNRALIQPHWRQREPFDPVENNQK
jgi:type II secretory pathway predicted ATPase ExeA